MSAMSVQPEPSRTKGLLPSLANTDARNSHMGSRLWIAHMMSTVLLVDTCPVKTDSKTRAGVHNDVGNPSDAQQSDRPGSWKEVKSSVSLPKWMESGQRKANSNTCRRQNQSVDYIRHTNNPQEDMTRGPTWTKGTKLSNAKQKSRI